MKAKKEAIAVFKFLTLSAGAKAMGCKIVLHNYMAQQDPNQFLLIGGNGKIEHATGSLDQIQFYLRGMADQKGFDFLQIVQDEQKKLGFEW